MPRLALALLVLLAPAAPAADAPLILRSPTLNRTHVVFAFAGDLWSVPRNGGEARRLTTGPGMESSPQFSPDGAQIAFTGEYDGNVDAYVVPASGGVPKRLTWHPADDTALGWTPDGKKVLITSTRTSYSRFSKLFTVPLEGGLEEELPLPMGYEAAYSQDGSQLAYVPIRRAFYAWKRYRGGTATPVWIASLADSRIEKIPRTGSNDFNPMWAAGKVWFLSDRNGPVTLFSYDPKTKRVARAVQNTGLDLKSASAAGDAIAYEQFGSLFIYDVKSGKAKPVPVTVAGDFPELRERLVKVDRRLTNAHVSPTGARAVFEARGEIVTVPAEKGDARNLTNTTAVMERDPAWSPDGKSVAYFSDESGEYMLHVRGQNGMGDPVKIPLGDTPGFYFSPRWSPDAKKVAYTDSHQALWCVDVADRKPVRIDKDPYWGPGNITPAWSPDSKWLTYSRRLKNFLGAVFVYSVADGNTTQVTDGMSDARDPVFDPDGKHLFFTASTDAGASLQPDIHSLSHPSSRSLYLVVLDKTLPSPFSPESDEEKIEPEKKPEPAKPEEAKGDATKPDAAKKPVTVKIDFDNILQRILAVQMPARNYTELQVGKPGVLLAIESPGFTPGASGPPSSTVHRYDLAKRKADVAISGVQFFEIARNGEKMLYRQGDRWYIAPVAGGGPPPPLPSSDSARQSPQHRLPRGPHQPAPGVAPDVPRGVAPGARLLLRPRLPWPRPEGCREKV